METARMESRWSGGVSPFAVSWQKMMMWWFIVTDALLFAGFLAAYGFNRLASDSWPDQAEVFHVWFITLMTFTLITSSATMATAVSAAARGDKEKTLKNLLYTVIGGACFLVMQAIEWGGVISEGATLTSNPWGPASFSAFFFMMTGFHGTHVLLGLIILLIVLLRARKGKYTAEGVELVGLYWHFVDLVWVFIFGCFYLI